MLQKVETVENSASGKSLNEFESTRKAAHLDRNRSRSSSRKVIISRSKSVRRTHLVDKKSKLQNAIEETPRKAKNTKSLWSWKSLKALSHIGNRPFGCHFFLHVHSIEGLPLDFDGTSLSVHWKNRHGTLTTHPAMIFQGMAEFEEQLSHTCSVYASRNGIGSHRSAKYEAKHCWLYASSCKAPELDLGKHQIDLTRLLPLELKKLEEENSSGNWTTSFKLSGKAKGAMINVSFRYSVIGDNCNGSLHDSFSSKYDNRSTGKSNVKLGEDDKLYMIRRAESFPSSTNHPSRSSFLPLEDIKELHEIQPTVQKFGEGEKNKLHLCTEQSISFDIEKKRIEESCLTESLILEKESVKSEKLALPEYQQRCMDLVGSEFSNLPEIRTSKMSSDSEPESPRERLLRQFEKEALGDGHCYIFDFNTTDKEESRHCSSASSDGGNSSQSFELSTLIEAMEEHQITSKAERNKTKAKDLEDLEAEALMREWGLNEKSFQHSPSISGGFGSPIDLPLREPLEMRLPPLGEGLGPFLQTKNGEFLRSMDPLIFLNAENGGSLIMHVSSPVIVPAKMGSEIMQILQCLASVGVHKLSMQANKLMPLEDITGKTLQQVAWDAASDLEKSERHCSSFHESISISKKGVTRKSFAKRFCSNPVAKEIEPEYVSLEDLAPSAMDKIESLSIEGLRIQSGLSDEDAPSNISAKPMGEFLSLHTTDSSEFEGAAGLMALSLTLDEWMRLDSGELEEEDCMSDRTCKLLAAHHANSSEFNNGGKKGKIKRRRGSKSCGLMGNNFTVALMVQLRDPLRNYEPVGAPMIALIQVERSVSKTKNNHGFNSSVKNDGEKEQKEKRILEEEDNILLFRVRDVHVAGIKTESGKKVWGNSANQKSGSRWLLANGMGKRSKHSFFMSMAATKTTTKRQPGDSLWSISACVNAQGEATSRYVRNPNVVF